MTKTPHQFWEILGWLLLSIHTRSKLEFSNFCRCKFESAWNCVCWMDVPCHSSNRRKVFTDHTSMQILNVMPMDSTAFGNMKYYCPCSTNDVDLNARCIRVVIVRCRGVDQRTKQSNNSIRYWCQNKNDLRVAGEHHLPNCISLPLFLCTFIMDWLWFPPTVDSNYRSYTQ